MHQVCCIVSYICLKHKWSFQKLFCDLNIKIMICYEFTQMMGIKPKMPQKKMLKDLKHIV